MKNSCGITSCEASIDLVYLWVNGSDPLFLEKKNRTLQRLSNSSKEHGYNTNILRAGVAPNRFRDFDELRYSLRSAHLNAPWARRIFIVTDDQIPSSVLDPDENTDLKLRIRLVSHHDFFSYAKVEKPKYPLFNSIAIQTMVHAIPTLSSPFMMMDDDFFFGRPVPKSYIFDHDGRAILRVHLDRNITFVDYHPYLKLLFNSIKVIGKRFPNSTEVASIVKTRKGTMHEHGPILLHPEDGFPLWELFPDEMTAEVNRPFRHHPKSANVQTLYRFLSIADIHRYKIQASSAGFQMVQLKDNSYAATMRKVERLREQGSLPYMLCINDDLTSEDSHVVGKASNFTKKSLDGLFPSVSMPVISGI